MKQFVYLPDCCFNSCVEQGHKDSVRKATVEEQLSSCVEQGHKDSVRKATVEEQLSSKTVHPAMTDQLHLPALELSWALDKVSVNVRPDIPVLVDWA